MKRHHFNMTNEPVTFSTWLYLKQTLNESDFKWLKGFDISVKIDAPTHEIHDANGTTRHLQGKPLITFDTTTEKQSHMLMLKFSEDIVLLQRCVVLPYETTQFDIRPF